MGIFSDFLMTVDYDRTMTGPDAIVPERNYRAIQYFMDNGGKFTVNTGRSLMTFGPFLDNFPANCPYLLYNGSAAWKDGKLINVKAIDLDLWDTVEKIRKALPELNLELQCQAGVHYLVDAKPEFERFYDSIGWLHAPATRDTDMGPFIKFALFGDPIRYELADMFQCTPEEDAFFAAAEKKIVEICQGKVDTCRSAPRIIDVQAKGVSKLNAARWLQKELGRKYLVCVGDAENDIVMLEGADYGFCPADGVVADRFPNVCKCGDGAVADVIYKKIPEILGMTLDTGDIL